MPKTTHRLTAVKVENLKRIGMHADGAGLYLRVTPTGAKAWIFRYMLNGRPRYLGLGSAGTVQLKAARTAAEHARRLCDDDVDPIEARKSARETAHLTDARAITFRACADGFRAQIHVEDGKAILYSRNGADLTKRFRSIRSTIEAIPARSAIIAASSSPAMRPACRASGP